MTAEQRAERTRWADELCTKAYDGTGVPETGVALVAVGGYGRGELATYSDLDVVLVLDDGVEPGQWAGDVWYPLWDSGAAIDHSVRTLSEMSTAAVGDVRVALGLLDARHLAGDPTITLRLRTALHNDWRKEARARLPQLREVVGDRVSVTGELAHAAVPDLKESTGGLRDATVLKALVASWLVDVPHTELEGARTRLLDVRDALHEVAGRATDRVAPEYWSDMAKVLGLEDDTTLQRSTRAAGRRITHLSRLTWSRAEAALSRPRTSAVRRPDLQRVAPGVAVSRGEVVLQRDARVAADPMLLLRAAAEAAERGLVLSPTTSARLVREAPALPDPWPAEARDLLVRLLAAGPGLLPVWETLDETGAIDTFLPEWEQVRLLPHASVVHRWTVDRHLVQTCIEAAGLIRRARRPDVLMVAALLHDIGKGGLVEHSVAGEPIARRVATRMGFAAREVDLVGQLVRRHLLLPEVATTRDPDDPATLTQVTAVVPDREVLDLLATLTEADARATSDQAWTSWRAGLVHSLHRRAAASLTEGEDPVPEEEHDFEVPGKVRRDPSSVFVQVDDSDDGAQVTVISGDRVGLLADAAAMLALQRVSVRAARARVVDDVCLSLWQVADTGLDESVLLQRLENIVEGRLDARERLSRLTPARIEPTVAVRPEASDVSTVIEVRAEDRPGVLFTVCRALADAGVAVRSMHVTTLGPQAIDVFYVQETGAGALGDVRASAAAHAIRSGLLEAVSLETPGAGT
ncbi:bifunctional uridylyltransferase/uridylyl-removing enzyme [Marmoricola endophyticus]|uniref:Bifunctional uridylyltransferase/uridylyl-removing enzyme n=1 Tax=Marmoricola endophyticus TaxID=2040280 RepID=A0A917F0S0_9ACTN|nr:[protein-PII] uridylyltransferase [Marmoricola endophyticus]GGF39021.1 bifunctional uridylyltransferase/uridylyl-removing enzyme [Marmoricola endophyticus]